MEFEESACLLIVGFGLCLLRNNWGGWRKQGERQLMWFGQREWTSAFDLMCGPIKTHGTGAISVSLSPSIVRSVCLSQCPHRRLSPHTHAHTIQKASSSPHSSVLCDRFLLRPVVNVSHLGDEPTAHTHSNHDPDWTLAYTFWGGEREGWSS